MDLKDRLTDCINANVNLPVKLYQSYMTNKTSPELRIYDLPSTVIDEDYAGNRTEEFIFEIAMRSNDEELINQMLWNISKYISKYDFNLVSQNDSFRQQYNIDLIAEQGEMHWDVFKALFDGLDENTYFRKILDIRRKDVSDLQGKEFTSVIEAQNYYELDKNKTVEAQEAKVASFADALKALAQS